MTTILMTFVSRAVAVGLFIVLLTSTACSQDGTHRGSLESGDPTLQNGEYYDAYPVEVQAGQWVEVDLQSDDFDTYVVLLAPSGTNEQNDDFEGSTKRSMLRMQATESGTWQVYATSYAGGETGRYSLSIHVGGEGDTGDAALVSAQGSGARFESGRLEAGDSELTSGEYNDEYIVQGLAGEQLVLDLHSSDFDPYLILIQPDGEQVENDDHDGDLTRSMITATLPADGAYRVLVTTYEPGSTGAYDLIIRGGGGEGSTSFAAASGVRTERGTLEAGDQSLRSGEYFDTYTFVGAPGQRITIDLQSSEFDTYLILQPPRGESVQDDDGGGDVGHSIIEYDLTEPGTYRVAVTSYTAEETGSYELKMDFSESFGQPSDGTTLAAGSDFSALVMLNAGELTLNETIRGALESSDRRLPGGQFVDPHVFDGEADEPVLIEMTSSSFDTYLIVTLPTGEVIKNDDFEGSTNLSRIEMIMPMDGRYRIEATSYAAGETGSYNLRINQMEAFRPDPVQYNRIAGLFVGISDYGGRLTNLQYTARDATVVRDALVQGAGMRPEDGIVLTDGAATRAAFRQSIRDLAARTDENTLFVLFYSGHGAQYDRSSPQAADPDGKDESIELVDGEILDDELNQLLGQLRANYQLIVLDACFSGGFAKDLISQPGRMGLFSSEEDVISFVADKFEAGGYLSHFFSDALVQRSADEDHNGAITPLELSQYIQDRYDGEMRNTGLEAIVARETRLKHQHLVVDRGSLGAFSTLFVLQ
ncbi:MAG: caspase family protein [Bacteroidetes bacterium]|nr:caspase family protein [Bacteroidota bacterium]